VERRRHGRALRAARNQLGEVGIDLKIDGKSEDEGEEEEEDEEDEEDEVDEDDEEEVEDDEFEDE
jgi:Sec-independent protein translocase protein TatA